jgi:N-acyl-D-aspartate/D-glutamate deacylase
MGFDLVVRGGTVVDGSGKERRRADVAVEGGKIVAVGEGLAKGRREVDASGCIVTPGFVDLHTHYDGQVSWDPDLLPSSAHGVTTCVIGNCGVGFAPVHEGDRQALIELMEGVEDIPGSALAEGIQWRWRTFTEYMKAVDTPHTIDIGVQVPHDALRVYVMRERGLRREKATREDIAKMRALVREALEAGAVGFSTGRSDNHKSSRGDDTPAAEVDVEELAGIGEAFVGLDHGILQAVSDFDMALGDDRFDAEFDVLEKMAEATNGHVLSISLSQRDMSPNQWRRILERCEKATARGVPMRVLVGARGIGVLLGLETTFHPFMGFPSYKTIAHLSLKERVERMRDPAFKAKLLTEKSDKIAGDGSPIPPLADVLLSKLDVVSMRTFKFGVSCNYEPSMDDSIYADAFKRGVPPLEAVYDAMLEQDGHALLYFPIFNYTEFSLDNVRTMLAHPLALPGLSDGGAHVGTVCDASFPTFMLTHWARDRKKDRFTLEHVVKMLAADTADFAGFHDRGRIEVGRRADLNVIDFDHLELAPPRLVRDLPGGGKRLLQDAKGYRATIVKGEIIAENGKLTGARPGRLARPGVRA